jgi:SHS2 domain-containing protein
MKRFELIEHTADTGLIAHGKTLTEAFANVGYGLFSIMAELRNVKEAESRIVQLNEPDAETLLFEWLNSLIYSFDVEMYFNHRRQNKADRRN